MVPVKYLDSWYVSRRSGFARTRRLAALVLLLSLLACASVAAPVVAQERLERLEVSLWPEYDRPAMLVMLRAWLPADAEFPVTISLPIPAIAGAPSAVAYRAADGSMLIAPNKLTTEGDTILVALTTPEPEIRLEYYVALDVDQPQRAYSFHWPTGIAVGRVTFDVLHPWGATDIEVTPAGTRKSLPDGRIEERGDLGALATTDAAGIEVRYTKLPEQPAAAATGTQAAATSAQGTAPTGRFATTEETKPDSRWLILLTVSSITFLCGFALGRRRKRP